jgi:NAD(P)-dependent dehydrogenase (short-subunit alcohol dehydrogenase family)
LTTATSVETELDRHRGRRVLITGGASGIGRAAARTLVSRGARVVVVDVDDAGGRALIEDTAAAAGGAVSYLHADVSSEAEAAGAVGRAVAELGGLDVLIHAAGIMAGQLQEIGDLDEQTWDRVVDINLKGAFLVAKHAAKVMVPAGAGVMILVASKAGVSVGSGS